MNFRHADKLRHILNRTHNFWGIKGSVGIHLCAFLLLMVKPVVLPSKPVSHPPAIRVDMVALPDKEPPTETKAPEPKPIVKAKKPKKKPQTKKKVKVKKTEKSSKPKANEFGKSAIEKIKQIQELKSKLDDDLVETQTVYKGNRISPGSSLQGLEKIDYDRYIDELRNHAKQYWSIPGWLIDSELTTQVRVFLDEDGFVIRQIMIESSGDSNFDQSVEVSISKASPFPRPVEKFIDLVRVKGIIFSLTP